MNKHRLFKGGQGRDSREIESTAWFFVAWLALFVLFVLAKALVVILGG